MPTIAILYPGHSAEDEFSALETLLPGTSFPVIHTWEGPTDHELQPLLDLGSRESLTPPAQQAADLAPDAVMWACTSGSFVYGLEGCREQAQWVRDASSAPASSTSLAFAAAMHHLSLRSAAIAATYPQAVAEHFTQLLRDDGLRVSAYTVGDIPSGEDAGRIGPEQLLAMVRSIDLTDADALLIPDTALHTIEHLPQLEDLAGMPVLTANQVTAWQGLELAGHHQQSQHLGRLFAT